MRQQKTNNSVQSFLFGGLLCVWTLSFGMPVHAAEGMTVALSCVPKEVADQKTDKNGVLSLASGQTPVFACTAKNIGTEKALTLLLVGKETKDKEALGASSADLTLSAGATGEATLQFPAVFQSGSYQYVFAAYDTETKQPASAEVTLNGVLKGAAQPLILSVAPGQNQYEWGAPVRFSLSLALPKGEKLAPETWFLDVSLQDQYGKTCASLTKAQAIVQAEDVYQVTLPGAGTCTNTLEIALTDKDGTLVDKKMVAIGLPEPEVKTPATGFSEMSLTSGSVFGVSKAILIGLLLTGVLVLALVGYFFMKSTKKRRF